MVLGAMSDVAMLTGCGRVVVQCSSGAGIFSVILFAVVMLAEMSMCNTTAVVARCVAMFGPRVRCSYRSKLCTVHRLRLGKNISQLLQGQHCG